MSTSRKHHYIPQAFIKGFKGDEGFYYAYNKKKDGIQLYAGKYHNGMEKYKSSDSIFFEWNRNTMYESEIIINDNPLIIENNYYKHFDDKFAPNIAALRNGDLGEYSGSNKINDLRNFIIVTLLRIPKFDDQLNQYANQPEGTLFDTEGKEITDEKTLDEFKSNKSFLKAQRFHFINNILKININNYRGKTSTHSIASSDANLFLLGDYPMLYPHDPHDLSLLSFYPVILPLSGKAIYYNFNQGHVMTIASRSGYENHIIKTYDFHICDYYLDINALIIDQSIELICGPDQQVLKESVEHYKKLKADNRLEEVRERLFSRRNYKYNTFM